MKIFISILVVSFIFLCSISLYAYWKQDNMGLTLSNSMKPTTVEIVFENYQVSDGGSGFENYQVSDGGAGFENYQVKQ
jgi:hypothetical protein